ncbi:MAG TPA: type II secretion system protein, partial [Euzebya sp.]|nr:type II secretion system protein [Euzebya sp.]
MGRTAEALRRRDGDDAGFSLPELLVTITLMSIISAAIITSTVAVQQNLGVANATMNDLNANRITIERVGHLLRWASAAAGVLDYASAALVTAQPDQVMLYSATGLDPSANPVQVQLAAEGTDMVERIWDPDPPLIADLARDESPTYPDPPRQRVIGRNVLSSTVFTYWTHSDDGTATGRC